MGGAGPPGGPFLTPPPDFPPPPGRRGGGRGWGGGASTGLQTWAAVAFRQGGLLSPTLSSKGGEGGPVVGWWQCQDALTGGDPEGKSSADSCAERPKAAIKKAC